MKFHPPRSPLYHKVIGTEPALLTSIYVITAPGAYLFSQKAMYYAASIIAITLIGDYQKQRF